MTSIDFNPAPIAMEFSQGTLDITPSPQQGVEAANGQQERRVLMLARDLSSGGGVVGYVQTLMQTLRRSVVWEHLIIGRRPGERGWMTPWRMARDYLTFLRAVRSGRHDVVHLNPSLTPKALARDLVFLAIAQHLGTVPQLVFIHGWDWATFHRIRGSVWRRRLLAHLLRGAQAIVVLSHEFQRALEDMGIPSARITVATTMFARADVPTAADLSRRLDAPPLRLLFLARVVREKGVLECIEAVRLLNAEGHDVVLLVAGDGPDLHEARGLAARLGLQDRVHFAGYLRGDDKGAALLSSHVFLLPSRHGEGCPVALLEAMASGLPVIATKVGGIPAIVEASVNGWLLEQATARALADAVATLTTDARLRGSMAEANRAKAWRMYEAEPVSQVMLGLYAHLHQAR